MGLPQSRLLAAAVALMCEMLASDHAIAQPVASTRDTWIAAAKAARLEDFGAYDGTCGSDCTVGTWLTRLTAPEARSLRWTTGRCRLTNVLNPLDAGTGAHCVQAVIDLRRPRTRADRPEIEVYLEKAKGGRPGKAYAFRGLMISADGPDYTRFPQDFASDWTSRFPAADQ
jgi:hypothetical protein